MTRHGGPCPGAKRRRDAVPPLLGMSPWGLFEKLEALREADARDWVFQAEERRRARGEAERWLWAARAVWLRGVVR